ncbi:MAG TPA: tRNA lysidine(34) synthetase TilS [Beijerinckiaceae bacterium]
MSRAAKPLTRADAAPLLEPYLLKRNDGPSGVVLAVSGGPDSVALMRLAAKVGRRLRVPVTIATVDHGLRPESRAEAETVGAWAAECGLPHRILLWTGRKPRTAVQEAARDARYRLLAGLAHEAGASHLLTAHTLDDQAETILMRLSRGTGVGGLAGMRAETALSGVVLARPFLCVPKARLVAACRANGWPFLEDPSNTDPRFARARWRRIMPALAEEGLTAERLAALAVRAQRAEEALEARAAAVLEVARIASGRKDRLELGAAALLAEPEAILLRVIARGIVAAAGGSARPVRLDRFEAHVLGTIRPALAEGVRLRLNLGGALIEAGPGRLRFSPEPPRRKGKGP